MHSPRVSPTAIADVLRSPSHLRPNLGCCFSMSLRRAWAPQGARRLTALIEQLRQRTTIVVIEHDMPFLFRIADRISVIQWGQVIAQGTPAELRADPWVARSNLGAVAA